MSHQLITGLCWCICGVSTLLKGTLEVLCRYTGVFPCSTASVFCLQLRLEPRTSQHSTPQTELPLYDYYIQTKYKMITKKTKEKNGLHCILQSWLEAWKSGSCSQPFKAFPRQNVCCTSHSSQPPHSPIKMPFRSLFSLSPVESASDSGTLPTPFSGGLFRSFETQLSLDFGFREQTLHGNNVSLNKIMLPGEWQKSTDFGNHQLQQFITATSGWCERRLQSAFTQWISKGFLTFHFYSPVVYVRVAVLVHLHFKRMHRIFRTTV